METFFVGGLILLQWLAYTLVPIAIVYLGVRFVRAQERRTTGADELKALRQRLQQLEQRLDGMADAVEEVAEGHRFTTAVLATRDAPPDRPAMPTRRPPG